MNDQERRHHANELRAGRAPFREPGGWRWSETKDRHRRAAVEPQLTERDNPVTMTLYGPDGKPLRQFTERPKVPFGYHGRGDA